MFSTGWRYTLFGNEIIELLKKNVMVEVLQETVMLIGQQDHVISYHWNIFFGVTRKVIYNQFFS